MSREVRLRVFKDPWSSTTHFAGFWLALGAAALLVSRAAGDLPRTTGMAIYGASLVGALPGIELLPLPGSRPARQPLAEAARSLGDLLPDRGDRRADAAARARGQAGACWSLGLVLGLAAAGALLKIFWIDCPGLARHVPLPGAQRGGRRAGHRIVPQLSGGALAWLVGGGLAYLLGAVIYSRQVARPLAGALRAPRDLAPLRAGRRRRALRLHLDAGEPTLPAVLKRR